MKTSLALSAALLLGACMDGGGGGRMGLGGTWQPGVSAASWQKTDKAPTGYQIKGCGHYNLDGQRVTQVCDTRSTGNPEFWRNHDRHLGGGIPSTN